jgi:hypothetical protein
VLFLKNGVDKIKIIRARIRVTLALIILSYPILSYPILSTPRSYKLSEVFLYKEKSFLALYRKKKLLLSYLSQYRGLDLDLDLDL